VSKSQKHNSCTRLSVLMILFFFFSFILLAFRDQNVLGYVLSAAVPLFILMSASFFPKLFTTDALLLSITGFLLSLGVLVLYAVRPSAAMHQIYSCGVGYAGMILCMALVRAVKSWQRIIWIIIPLSFILLTVPFLFGSSSYNPADGSISSITGEMIKIILVIVLAYFLSRGYHIPSLLFGFVCILLLFIQKNFDSAVLTCGTVLLLLWASSGGFFSSLLGLTGFAALSWYGYLYLPDFQSRVAAWLKPLADQGDSDNLIQAIVFMSSSGLWGNGLGLTSSASDLLYESEYLFSILCGQFGIIFAICVLLILAAFIWRSTSISASSRSGFYGLLSMGCTIQLGLQTFLSIGGIFKLIPLTGASLPFLSFDSASLVSALCMTGLILGVENLNLEAVNEAAHLTLMRRS